MFKVIDLIAVESVLRIPCMPRCRACDHIDIDIDIIPRRILHSIYFVDKQTLSDIFFYFGLVKFGDKRRCENVYANSKSQEFYGLLDYEQIECVLCKSQRDICFTCVIYLSNRKFVVSV